MKKTNPKVDSVIGKAKRWREEFETLRALVLDCGLAEDLKWGSPCYAFEDANVVLIHGFKEYCALLFFKGALMKDPKGILIKQTANVQGPRQLRFSSVKDITKQKATVKAYIKEAIAVEKAGLKVNLKKTSEFAVPEEFKNKLDQLPALKSAFRALTPGRQRAYLLYFSSAKQSTTRASRVEKSMQRIMMGKGLDD